MKVTAKNIRGKIIAYLMAFTSAALVTAVFLPVRDLLGNAAAVALVFIFIVVLVAIRWGLGPSVAAAVSGMVAFNFFFLLPYYTFTISGYDDIVLYLAFIATSFAVGKLSAQAKSRADTAEMQLEKIEGLYAGLQQQSNERERAEQALQEAQEELVRKEKLAILGQLSGSVGHELRNPLGVMSNAVYFLKMVLSDADETTREYLEIIKKEIENSQRIITDLLDFARTKAPQRAAVRPEELVRQSVERCAIPENVTVTVEVPDGLPSLNVDPLQMGQVLTNFITNAVQAMPAGGVLTIRGEQDGEGTVRLDVVDSGEGISPENMEKLFQPLFTTKAKGIGLGLVVCKNLMEANGGRIEVESETGKGTTFTMLLPVEAGEG